jgi:hypothetical protein
MALIHSPDWDRSEFRRRAISFIIALAIEALLIIAILSLSMQSASQKLAGTRMSTFDVASASKSAPAAAANAKVVTQNVVVPNTPVPAIPPPLLPSPNKAKPPPPPGDFIKVSKADLDAMDISKLPSSGGDGNTGKGKGGAGMMGPGEGPGGMQLYPVAWYREPTDAELSPYLAGVKRIPPGAWAEIACRMIERYHVENCRPLGESPRGSGLAKALRLASWQFLVKPPREGNKVLLGTWVRIRFDFGKLEKDEAVEE